MIRLQAQRFALLTLIACAFLTFQAWGQRPAAQPPKGTKMQGQIVRIQGPNQFVVRTADKREVIVHASDRTKFLLNERTVKFAELQERHNVTVLFDVVNEQNLASSVTIAEADEAAEVVEGTI